MLVQDVNFFGHAAVASWQHRAPAVLLGAMLPDFATMSGARIAHATGDLAVGIEHHHATDATFHRLPIVTGLMRELDERLLAGGCARGPRRAVAHIGVELLLDGILVTDPTYRDAYTTALAHDPDVTWRDPDDAPRFARLHARLRAHGVPDDLRDPASITTRLARMLAHRPLLAPSPTDLRAIASALTAFQPRLTAAASSILHALRGASARSE